MPLTEYGIYYADANTPMSLADIIAAMATSVNNNLNVIQAVSFTGTQSIEVYGNNTYVPSNVRATITPTSKDSKILIVANIPFISTSAAASPATVGCDIALFRGATRISRATVERCMSRSSLLLTLAKTVSISELDEPSTTNPVTYSISGKASISNAYMTMNTGSITLLEVA
jgi:hypothetical protein